MLEQFDKFLSQHINVELKRTGMDTFTFLNEEHGHVDYIDDYVYAVDKALEEDGLSAFDSPFAEFNPVSTHFKINIYDELPWFKENLEKYNEGERDVELPFFDTIELNLDVMRTAKKKTIGGYDEINSKYNGKGKGTICINILITAPTKDDVKSFINNNIEHEFLHALDDCERRQKNSSLNDYHKSVGYMSYLNPFEQREKYEKYISNLLYQLDDSEINASVAEIFAELRANKEIIMGKDDKHSIMELIRNTNVYKKIGNCEKWLDDLRTIEHINLSIRERVELKNDLLEYTNKKFKNINLGDQNDYFETTMDGHIADPNVPDHFDRYNDIIKYFERQIQKFERRVLDKGSKMACDIYLGYGKYARMEKKYMLDDDRNRFQNKYGRKILFKDKK